jgi:hypothetical protein
MIRHAIDQEKMESIRCPGIPDADGFQNYQRLLEFDRQFDRTLQREIRMQPSERGHPVHDESAISPQGGVRQTANTNTWYGWKHTIKLFDLEEDHQIAERSVPGRKAAAQRPKAIYATVVGAHRYRFNSIRFNETS